MIKFDFASLAQIWSQWVSKERYSSRYMPRNLYVLSFLTVFSLQILPSLNILEGSLGFPISLLLYYSTPLVSRLILILAPLGLKIIYFVFPTLTAILLALNQFPNFWISRLTLSMSKGRSVSESKPAVSSAYNTVSRLVAKCRSLMKHRNRMGPRMLPCNTEMLIALFVDFTPEISVNWVLFDK